MSPSISPSQQKPLTQPRWSKRCLEQAEPTHHHPGKTCTEKSVGVRSKALLYPSLCHHHHNRSLPESRAQQRKSVPSINTEHNPATAALCAMDMPARRCFCESVLCTSACSAMLHLFVDSAPPFCNRMQNKPSATSKQHSLQQTQSSPVPLFRLWASFSHPFQSGQAYPE